MSDLQTLPQGPLTVRREFSGITGHPALFTVREGVPICEAAYCLLEIIVSVRAALTCICSAEDSTAPADVPAHQATDMLLGMAEALAFSIESATFVEQSSKGA